MIAVVLIQTNMFKHVVLVYKMYLSVFKFQSEFPNAKFNISSRKKFAIIHGFGCASFIILQLIT